MKKHLCILLVFLTLFSCADNDDVRGDACGIDNPTENLTWLKNEINQRGANPSYISKYFYIAQATYNSQTVLVYENCCPTCNTVVIVYDCEGNSLGQINVNIDRDEIKNAKIIYQA